MNQSWTSPNKQIRLFCGDCREVLPTLQQEVTAVVTDPPYGLEFMGQDWDKQVPGRHFWELINQVCVPGSPLLSFGGTRTYHRLVCAIEDAGWEIRDFINWVYGTGFPKSHDISKAIDKAAGVEFSTKPASGVGFMAPDGAGGYNITKNQLQQVGEQTDVAKQWQGHGTALKPAHEPICLAMKPLSEKSYAKNALVNGVAGINVDGCRVSHNEVCKLMGKQKSGDEIFKQAGRRKPVLELKPSGRWPANVIHDGTQDIARFFYCAKPTEKEKDANFKVLNTHSTVKPLALMRYLLKLVTMPKRNLVLDPFMGSGTTGVACQELGLPFIGIDDNERSFQIARDRIIASNTERDNQSNTNSDSINAIS